MPVPESALPARRGFWTRLSSTQRRRIVLGTLVAVSLAARDALLLLAAGTMFAVSELAPRVTPPATRAA